MQPDELLKRIECLREELYRLIEYSAMNDKMTLVKSQKLDKLLVKYQKKLEKDEE